MKLNKIFICLQYITCRCRLAKCIQIIHNKDFKTHSSFNAADSTSSDKIFPIIKIQLFKRSPYFLQSILN